VKTAAAGGVAAAWAVFAACGPKAPATAPGPAAASAEPAQVKSIQAVVLANECAGLGKQNAKLAEDAMNKLVDKCTSVPHGAVRFAVTLHPGGGLQFGPSGPSRAAGMDGGAPAAQAATTAHEAEDEVPMCALSHKLTHDVKLQKPCTIQVRLEEATLALAAKPAAPAASSATASPTPSPPSPTGPRDAGAPARDGAPR
jgi:hypothetical protein